MARLTVKAFPWHWLGAASSFVIFLLALWAIHRSLAEYHLQDILHQINALPLSTLLQALGVTLCSYWVLTGYDYQAVRHLRINISYPKVALTSFVAFAASHNIGLALLSGGAVRYRFYSHFGLSAVQTATIALLCAFTFGVGAIAYAGLTLVLEPARTFSDLPVPSWLPDVAGWIMLLAVGLYIVATALWRRPFTFRDWSLTLPSPLFSISQVFLAVLDLSLAALVLYLLLPEQLPISYLTFVGIYIIGIMAGTLAHVPGGLGVFEATLIHLLPEVSPAALLGSILAYRAIYLLLPLFCGGLLLGGYEAFSHRLSLHKTGRGLAAIMPPLMALLVFLAGTLLLLSGALPLEQSRLAALVKVVPLPLVEASHFLGSVCGFALLFLARGLYRRLDGAYLLTLLLLIIGAGVSLLKDFDLREAAYFGLLFLLLLPARRHFHRKARLLDQPMTVTWVLAVGVIVAATLWLGQFATKHVDYAQDLWWQTAIGGDAPRILRASLALVVLALGCALFVLLRPARFRLAPAEEAAFVAAERIAKESDRSAAALALLGDKELLFNEDKTALLMYGVHGRSWIALGDPLGPKDAAEELAWHFREHCHHQGGRAVFYLVASENLPLYLNLGLTAIKMGEEARVDLATFDLADSHYKHLRQEYRHAQREGASFKVIPQDQVLGIMDQLKAISDDWLATKHASQKGFSVGRFDPAYLRHFPCGVVRQEGEIVAFANLWLAAEGTEASVDLMRYSHKAPKAHHGLPLFGAHDLVKGRGLSLVQSRHGPPIGPGISLSGAGLEPGRHLHFPPRRALL